MLISKTARKYALNTKYAFNNEIDHTPNPQRLFGSLNSLVYLLCVDFGVHYGISKECEL